MLDLNGFHGAHRIVPASFGELQNPPRSRLGTFRHPTMRSGGYDPTHPANTAPPFLSVDLFRALPFINTSNPGVKRFNVK